MNKKLVTILKKRYGLFLVLFCLSTIASFVFFGLSSIKAWKYSHLNYTLSSQEAAVYFEIPVKPFLFTNFNNSSYYLKGSFTFFLFLVALIGFSIFFVDLKTNFNEFLFSLNVSKRKIYVYKCLFTFLPILCSTILGKFLYFGIIIAGIPSEYVNISLLQIAIYILGSLITTFLYFFCGAFLGIITGHIIFGPLLMLYFAISLNSFVSGIITTCQVFGLTHLASENSLIVRYLATQPINLAALIGTLLFSLMVSYLGSLYYSKLTLEKKGQFLLFNQLRLPLIASLTIYVPIVINVIDSSEYYLIKEVGYPLANLISTALFTVLFVSGFIYKKPILQWFQQKLSTNQ